MAEEEDYLKNDEYIDDSIKITDLFEVIKRREVYSINNRSH